jgi:hypothetical protein
MLKSALSPKRSQRIALVLIRLSDFFENSRSCHSDEEQGGIPVNLADALNLAWDSSLRSE